MKVMCVALLLGMGTLVLAQKDEVLPSRSSAPSGAEIAGAARGVQLDAGSATTKTMFGKPFKFTPSRSAMSDKAADGKGVFLGVLENGAVGDETGLPPGKYNLYVANVNGQLKTYAEANGKIVREAIRTTQAPASPGPSAPRFGEKGWYVQVKVCALGKCVTVTAYY